MIRRKPPFRAACSHCDRPSSDHQHPFTLKRCPDGSGNTFTPSAVAAEPPEQHVNMRLSLDEVSGLKQLLALLRSGRDARVLLATAPLASLEHKVNLKARREG